MEEKDLIELFKKEYNKVKETHLFPWNDTAMKISREHNIPLNEVAAAGRKAFPPK